MTADALFLATGKHELRGVARDIAGRTAAVGLRAALAPAPSLGRELAGTIELHLFEQGYAGLLLQEDGSANFCLSVSRRRLAAAGGAEALLGELTAEAPLLADRLGGAPPAVGSRRRRPLWLAGADHRGGAVPAGRPGGGDRQPGRRRHRHRAHQRHRGRLRLACRRPPCRAGVPARPRRSLRPADPHCRDFAPAGRASRRPAAADGAARLGPLTRLAARLTRIA